MKIINNNNTSNHNNQNNSSNIMQTTGVTSPNLNARIDSLLGFNHSIFLAGSSNTYGPQSPSSQSSKGGNNGYQLWLLGIIDEALELCDESFAMVDAPTHSDAPGFIGVYARCSQ
jgi:hypothetical protein